MTRNKVNAGFRISPDLKKEIANCSMKCYKNYSEFATQCLVLGFEKMKEGDKNNIVIKLESQLLIQKIENIMLCEGNKEVTKLIHELKEKINQL